MTISARVEADTEAGRRSAAADSSVSRTARGNRENNLISRREGSAQLFARHRLTCKMGQQIIMLLDEPQDFAEALEMARTADW